MWPFTYVRDVLKELSRISAALAAIAATLPTIAAALWAIQAELKGLRDDQTKIVGLKATPLETKERP